MAPRAIDPPDTDAVAIVTGSGGADRAIASKLATRGYTVALVYLGDRAGADRAVEDILSAGGTAIAVRADITDQLDVERLFSETAAMFGRVDLVVRPASHDTSVVDQEAARRLGPGGVIVDAAELAPAAEPGTSTGATRVEKRDLLPHTKRDSEESPA